MNHTLSKKKKRIHDIPEININGRIISTHSRPFLVAEIGLNHNKDIQLAKKMIYSAKRSGADAVKFQSYATDKFIQRNAPNAKGLFNIFHQYELNYDQHLELKEFCNQEDILFFSTPLTLDWVENLEKINIPLYKIASGDLNNYWLLDKIANCKKPIIISTGGAKFSDIRKSMNFLQKKNMQEIIILHCISIYPTPLSKINLNRMKKIEKEFKVLTGFSDHTENVQASVFASLLGASVIEKHFTLDKNLPGPDHKFSITPKEFSILREQSDIAFQIRLCQEEDSWPEEFANEYFGKRSLYKENGKWLPMRPRQKGLIKDSDLNFFEKSV